MFMGVLDLTSIDTAGSDSYSGDSLGRRASFSEWHPEALSTANLERNTSIAMQQSSTLYAN